MVKRSAAVYAVLLLVFAAGFLFHASDGARPFPPREPRNNAAVPHPGLRDDEPHHRGDGAGTRSAGFEVERGAEGRTTRADDDDAAPSETASVRGDERHHHHCGDADETGTGHAGVEVEVEGAEGRRVRANDDGATPSATASLHRDLPRHQHHRDAAADETGAQSSRVEAEVAERRVDGDDDGSAAPWATAASTRGEDQGGAAMPRHRSASSLRSPSLLRSKLARRARVLAGAPPVEGAADSAARSSCHSSDVHISCSPPLRN